MRRVTSNEQRLRDHNLILTSKPCRWHLHRLIPEAILDRNGRRARHGTAVSHPFAMHCRMHRLGTRCPLPPARAPGRQGRDSNRAVLREVVGLQRVIDSKWPAALPYRSPEPIERVTVRTTPKPIFPLSFCCFPCARSLTLQGMTRRRLALSDQRSLPGDTDLGVPAQPGHAPAALRSGFRRC